MKLLNQEQLPGLVSQPGYIQEWMATTKASLASDPNGKHNAHAEYFAYTSDLKKFSNYLATHFNGETFRFVMYHPYIFHWAAGVPYGKPLAVAQRIRIFDHIATLLTQEQFTRDKIEKLFTDKFSQGNLWGENVLQSAVASMDISDTETAEFMKKLLNYVVCDKLPTLLLSKNNGGLTVLDYANLRGKPQTLRVLTDALLAQQTRQFAERTRLHDGTSLASVLNKADAVRSVPRNMLFAGTTLANAKPISTFDEFVATNALDSTKDSQTTTPLFKQ